MEENTLRELLEFLKPSSQPHVRDQALNFLCGLSGSVEGRASLNLLILDFASALLNLIDDKFTSKEAVFLGLVNFSSDDRVTRKLCEFRNYLERFLKMVCDPTENYSDPVCMILSNISRDSWSCQQILEVLNSKENDVNFAKLIEVFCNEDFNPKARLHFLGPMLANLTQLPEARKFMLDKERCVLQRLLPFTQYNSSEVRRRAAITALKNCCFETEYHDWLLSEEVDILPHLLLPLAGPEELKEEDMEGLPDDLQYLEEDKQRESDLEIRIMLMEAIMKLCTTKNGRKVIREKRAYVIVREYHKWEKNEAALEVCAKLITLLISDEPEVGLENLENVEIPDEIAKQLEESS